MATVIDRLHDRLGTTDENVCARALRVLGEALPVNRPVDITDEAIEATVAGDVVLLRCLFAPEEEPEPDEIAALRELDEPSRTARDDQRRRGKTESRACQPGN